jgi:hypothetical protein
LIRIFLAPGDLGFQRDYLAANLTGYEVLGVGRDDGREAGEMMALLQIEPFRAYVTAAISG